MSGHSPSRILLLTGPFLLLFPAGCGNARLEAERTKAESQVRRWADTLDSQTTETGVYLRPEKSELPERDPWGASLSVSYSQGGAAETLVARSVGPDGTSHTEDDITAQRSAVNLKGIGQGIKKNVAETAEEAAKGTARGLIRGAKEGIQDMLKKEQRAEKEKEETESGEARPNP